MSQTSLDLLIRNVQVVSPTRDAVETLDIGIRDGRFARLEAGIDPADAVEVREGNGLHGKTSKGAQQEFLMIDEDESYDFAHFEFIMRSASRLIKKYPQIADQISVSLHCELADILNAYTRIVQKEGKLSGLKAYSAARPPHSEGLAIWIAAYLAYETECLNINLLHLSSRKAVDAAMMMQATFPHINFRREVTIGHLLLRGAQDGQPGLPRWRQHLGVEVGLWRYGMAVVRSLQ